MSANESAIGLTADALETPALVLDLAAYRRNVQRMAAYITGRHGLAWRPHMKGQKATPLALEAVQAGAIGVTCATLYEAEAMAAAGVASILIANQIVGERKLDRLGQLAQRTPGVMAATDSVTHARLLAAAAARAGVTLQVLIEVNVGMNRCGADAGTATVALAHEIHTALPSLRLAGLMGWEGHVLTFDDPTKQAKINDAMTALTSTAEACRAAGIPIPIVSSSGSGTFRMAAPLPGITEVQAGGGVFSDLNYEKWGLTDHEFALTVMTRVVSRPAPGRAIVDGGFKTMSVQHGSPKPLGIPIKSLLLSAEHGTLELADESPDQPAIGSVVSFVPGYTDSTVCLHDEMCVVEDGKLVAVWPIPGRTGRRA